LARLTPSERSAPQYRNALITLALVGTVSVAVLESKCPSLESTFTYFMLKSLLLPATHAVLSCDLRGESRRFFARSLREETLLGHVRSVFPANATPPRRLAEKVGVVLLLSRSRFKCRTGELGQCSTTRGTARPFA
jgi:hypothetical protein